MGDPLSSSSFSTMVREFEANRNDPLIVNLLMDSLTEMTNTEILSDAEDASFRTYISSMGKLLSLVDSDSALAWSIINVLENYLDASSFNNSVIEVKKLTPILSKLAVSAHHDDRKVSLLKVLQALTYGIKLMYGDPFLAPLFATLVSWSKSKHSTVVQLSLSVIANLLHQNNVAIYSLIQTVNLKAFMNDLLMKRGNIWCKMEVYKLMFLLGDLTYENPEEKEVLNFIKVSLLTVLETSKCENRSQLQHCISFFADAINSKKISVRNLHQPWVPESVCQIVDLLETGLDTMNLDVAMLLFKLIGILVPFNISTLSIYNSKIMKLGVRWVQRHTAKAREAVNTMQLIACHISGADLTCGLTGDDLVSVFIPLLKISPISKDDYQFLTVLLNFFSVTLDIKTFSITLQSSLTNDVVELFLSSIPMNLAVWNDYSSLEHIIEMEQKVLSLLSVALICGSGDLKAHVLSLVSSVNFPGDCLPVLAKAMEDGGRGCLAPKDHRHIQEMSRNPSFNTVSTFSELKNILHSLKNKNEMMAGDQILRLYQYNDYVNSDIQKYLSSSLREAIELNSLLEEKMFAGNQILNQFREKYEQLQPEFDRVYAKYEDANKKIQSYVQEISALKERLSQETSNCQKTIQSLKETTQRQEKEVYELNLNIQVLKEQLSLKEAVVASQQEELVSLQMEKSAWEKMEEQHEIFTSNLKKEIAQVELLHKQAREKVAQLENDKNNREKEIQELQRIRDTVFELTGGRKKL